MVNSILLKRPGGTAITGFPNSSALGGTGETPYNHLGKPIVENMELPFNAETNIIKLDDYGLDGEGLVALKDGNEIVHINPFHHDKRTQLNLPEEFSKRRPNRGMEGLAVTPDQRTLIGTMQSTMFNPTKAVKKLNLVRLVSINLEKQEVKQYLYQQAKNQNANSGSGIASLSQNEFLVIERDGKFLRDDKNAMKHIYRIDISKATNLENVENGEALTQDPKLGLLINGETLEQVVFKHGWQILEKHNIKPVSKVLVADLVYKGKLSS
jgi:hypothetical protein